MFGTLEMAFLDRSRYSRSDRTEMLEGTVPTKFAEERSSLLTKTRPPRIAAGKLIPLYLSEVVLSALGT